MYNGEAVAGPQPNMVPITEAESAAEPTGLPDGRDKGRMLTEDTLHPPPAPLRATVTEGSAPTPGIISHKINQVYPR